MQTKIEAQRRKVLVLCLLMVVFGGATRAFTHGHRWPTIITTLCVVVLGVLALVQFAKLKQMEKP